ncbi:MAG: type II toxin-antitoxin system VapC family toxin [Thermoguttaceae bacterium]
MIPPTNSISRVYVDTSVVGGVFDKEFDWQTKPFWEAVQRGQIIALVSYIVERELEPAPLAVQNFLKSLPSMQVERIGFTPAAVELGNRYIAEKVIGETSQDDCLHIALATIYRADVLVSWNFKHIVNVHRIRGYNGVNMLLGYPTIDIRTPYEVIHDI